MKTRVCTAAAIILLGGCGGGGGADSGTGSASTPARHLDAYLGTWVSSCTSHAIDTIVIAAAPGGADAITVMPTTDYYANADCTGGIVATLTQSASATATYTGTVEAPVASPPPLHSVVAGAKVDTLSANLPAHTVSVTGTAVTHTVVNGQAQWCIAYADGSSTCLQDKGTLPAQANVAGGLWLNGNLLYDLTAPRNGIYYAEQVYTKK